MAKADDIEAIFADLIPDVPWSHSLGIAGQSAAAYLAPQSEAAQTGGSGQPHVPYDYGEGSPMSVTRMPDWS